MIRLLWSIFNFAAMDCKITGPGCSKLTMSLVNVSLKFQTLISEIRQYFCCINASKSFSLVLKNKILALVNYTGLVNSFLLFLVAVAVLNGPCPKD